MGRQAAGTGFLRAAVQARGDEPLAAYTPFPSSAESFRRTVAEIDPAATTVWIPGQRLDLLAQAGVLYRPDQILGPMARQRLRVGPAAYSLCGVTHTLATHTTLDAVAKILVEPVMPWDALVCTSTAALAGVNAVLDRETEYQCWRSGRDSAAPRPLLPVIPLGVHCADFAFTDDERSQARQALALGAETVAVLFAGRLSIGAKFHPYAAHPARPAEDRRGHRPHDSPVAGGTGLQRRGYPRTASRSRNGRLLPPASARCSPRRQGRLWPAPAWAAADIFISMADSIQETFGITPVEAMAAGLPALVSDWNGYKDTVRDGVDGFRIATWTPPPGDGEIIAHDHEIGLTDYENYLSRCNTAVAVDVGQLGARLAELVTDEPMRRRMGAAGRARARSVFDWSVVFASYQALWDEQTAIRRKAAADPASRAWLARAPRSGADHMGPFDTFAAYPTHHVTARTRVSLASDLTPEGYRELITQQLLALSPVAPELVDLVLAALRDGPTTVEGLARAAGPAGRMRRPWLAWRRSIWWRSLQPPRRPRLRERARRPCA